MQILTANELLSGATVYLDTQGRWVEELQSARVFSPDEAEPLEAARAAAQGDGRLLSVETEAVTIADGLIHPLRLRERIRAEGPTAPRMDRQHLDEDGHVSL